MYNKNDVLCIVCLRKEFGRENNCVHMRASVRAQVREIGMNKSFQNRHKDNFLNIFTNRVTLYLGFGLDYRA